MPKPNQRSIQDLVKEKLRANPDAFKQAQKAQIDLVKTYEETGKIPSNWSLVDDFINETARQQSWDALNEPSD